jgi:hypothetical protein
LQSDFVVSEKSLARGPEPAQRTLLLQTFPVFGAIRPFHDEKGVSQYFESMFRPEDEIQKSCWSRKTHFADSVSLFVNAGDSLRLRCSKKDREIITATGGLIPQHERTAALVVSDISEKKIEVRYLKKAKLLLW